MVVKNEQKMQSPYISHFFTQRFQSLEQILVLFFPEVFFCGSIYLSSYETIRHVL